jgi:hypothetical protein
MSTRVLVFGCGAVGGIFAADPMTVVDEHRKAIETAAIARGAAAEASR